MIISAIQSILERMFIYNEPFLFLIPILHCKFIHNILIIKMIAAQQLVILKPNAPITTQAFQSVQWLSNMLNDDQWDVGQGRYQVFSQMKLFKHAQTLNVKQFKLRWTRNEQVLLQISPISFPYLKQLFLNGNSLTSIQALTLIHLPCLQSLNLKQNDIRQIGSLRRCNIPNLKEISLYKNKICDIQKISQLNAPKLHKIWLNGKLEDGNIIGSISWSAKIESNKLKTLIINHQKRIEQQSAMQALNRKSQSKLTFEYVMQDDRGLNWL